jgi:hypothetical protein
LAAAFLRWSLPESLRDDALDDVADGHALRLALFGRRAADRWYRRQVPLFALRLRFALLTGGPLAAPPVRQPALTGSERMTTILADVRYGARGMVRNVFEFARSLEHAFAHLARHVLLPVQRTRNGGDRNLRQPRHVTNGYAIGHCRPR